MQRLRQLIPILIAGVLLGLSIWAIKTELRHYRLEDILNSLAQISKTRKLEALGVMALGYLSMTGYDWLGFRYIRHPLALGKIIFTSFLSYAIGNTVGFTLFSGTAIRYRLYTPWGVSTLEIAKIMALPYLW